MKRTALLGAVALAVLGAQAAVTEPTARDVMDTDQAIGADLVPQGRPAIGARAAPWRKAAPGTLAAGDVAVEDVGDIHSFGRNMRWLGIRQMNVELSDSCPPDLPEDSACQPLAASGITTFTFNDLARFNLPAKSSNSLLCHWFSPYLSLDWENPGAVAALGTLTYTPTLTVENPVLDDPALINAQTGLPFGGSLLTGMSASERIVAPLGPGMAYSELQRDTATCIAGFISHRALVENYGLSESLATEFFKQPMVVRMNIRGSASHLSGARLIFGLRIVGD